MESLENTQTENTPAQPIPVFDVSCDHVYHGGVPKPFFVFLWASVAFVIGALLPWGSDPEAPMGLLQVFVLLGGLMGVWGSLMGIRGRRLSMGGVMMAELIALIAILFFAKWTLQEYKSPEVQRLTTVRAQLQIQHDALAASGAPKSQLNNIVDQFNTAGTELSGAREASVMCDVLEAPIAVFTTNPDTPERRALMSAWNTFGTGFYTVAVDMIFVGIFLLFSVVMAMTKGKKKEEPVRRVSRRGKGTETASNDDSSGDATDA